MAGVFSGFGDKQDNPRAPPFSFSGDGSIPSASQESRPPLFRGPLPPGRLFHPPANTSASSASQESRPPLFRGPLPPGRLFHPPASASAAAAPAASSPMDRRPPFVNDNYDFTLESYIMNAEGSRLGGTVIWKNTTLNERIAFLNMLDKQLNLNNPHISEFLRAIRWRIERDILSITMGNPIYIFSDQVQFDMAALCYMFPDEVNGIQSNWMISPIKTRRTFLRYLLTKQNSIYGDAVRHMLGNLGNNGSAASSDVDNVSNATVSGKKAYDPTARARNYPSVNPKYSTNNVRRNSSKSATASKASNSSKASNAANAANLESALPRRTGPYKSPYASSSSASSSSASSAPRASAAATKAAANQAANKAAAAKARARMEDLARQEASQRAPAAQAEGISSAYETVKAAGNKRIAMRDFLKRFDPTGDWNAKFSKDNSDLKRDLMMLHPDKHPNNSPKYTELFKTALNFRKTLGGTRRRARHAKNKSGRKRRTHRH